ncbi:uncharacterized protein LOC114318394 isoform X4 [Camellia sinensis]|uniref:uncharacterized protein LOC114318394 isoform X4 n=1 Tax=Camellia sinensis TaxID=4442 RepID=UPI0010366E79|nr:uncharacterized protein LOC114318394 isoform X4 [Camellia sinensis]
MAKEGEATSKTIPFEEGWPVLQDAINKLIDSLEGVCPHTFTAEEYMTHYTCFTANRRLPKLLETSFMTFYELVYGEMNDQVRDAVISMVCFVS